MAKDTRIRILQAALELFAKNGYTGTNLKEIADAVGIVKSALYRHFTSKEEIWQSVVAMVADYYCERFGSPEHLPMIPKTAEELRNMTHQMVDFTIHDEKVIQMRKVLTTEQFRYESVRDLANRYFLYDTEAIFTKVFENMMANGSLKPGDPKTLAFAYTTPITALIHFVDREPEKEREALARMESFVQQFIETYGA